MLLFLALLMVRLSLPPLPFASPTNPAYPLPQSMYLLTSLISLPSSPSESSALLLDTLPSFDVFSRLFDSAFLLAAGTVFVLRWVERKIRVEEPLSSYS